MSFDPSDSSALSALPNDITYTVIHHAPERDHLLPHSSYNQRPNSSCIMFLNLFSLTLYTLYKSSAPMKSRLVAGRSGDADGACAFLLPTLKRPSTRHAFSSLEGQLRQQCHTPPHSLAPARHLECTFTWRVKRRRAQCDSPR